MNTALHESKLVDQDVEAWPLKVKRLKVLQKHTQHYIEHGSNGKVKARAQENLNVHEEMPASINMKKNHQKKSPSVMLEDNDKIIQRMIT